MIAVIGCGNPNRSDDGVGPAVIRSLAARGLAETPQVRLLDAGTDGMAVMFAARGCRTLIIVDACRSGSEPGAVFEVEGEALAQRHAPSYTLHDFRWDHALFAGRRMFGTAFPDDVTVLLVETASVDLGLALSEPVAAAAETVTERIEGLVRARLAAGAVTVKRGSLYVPAEIYERYFSGLASVVLQRDGDDLAILPVHSAASGGYLMKRRNAHGDRVVGAADFFRSEGIEDETERDAAVSWDEAAAALRARGIFAAETAP